MRLLPAGCEIFLWKPSLDMTTLKTCWAKSFFHIDFASIRSKTGGLTGSARSALIFFGGLYVPSASPALRCGCLSDIFRFVPVRHRLRRREVGPEAHRQ